MRNMSFMLTTEQIKNRTKTVTRRLGWDFLKPGDLLCACEKCMGLKKGEKIIRLATIRVVGVRIEPLQLITDDEAIKEGFPNMTGEEFLDFFCHEMNCHSNTNVNRIEFEYA